MPYGPIIAAIADSTLQYITIYSTLQYSQLLYEKQSTSLERNLTFVYLFKLGCRGGYMSM